MSEQFKAGDIVRLRAGGSNMTVVSSGPDGVRCRRAEHSEVFQPDVLEMVETFTNHMKAIKRMNDSLKVPGRGI